MLAVIAAFGLASCDADQLSQTLVGEANKTAAVLKSVRPQASLTRNEPAGSPDAVTVVTDKSVPAYYKDLQHCRNVVATTMGPRGEDDDVEALRRALRDNPHAKVLTPVYINEDRAIKRRESIKQCLYNLGYIVARQ